MAHFKGNIVVVDDDNEMRSMLTDFLVHRDYDVKSYPNAKLAIEALLTNKLNFIDQNQPDVIITDLAMPEMDGLEFIQNLKPHYPELPVILITAYGSIDTAVEATRKGAYAYVVKPFKLNEFEVTVEKALSHHNLIKENVVLREEVNKSWSQGKIIGKSKAMQQVFEVVARVSKATANILITGDSGTGKELVARSIHENGPRKNKPFVAINCTAIPDTLLEAELFGYVKGAFTGAMSDKKGLFEEAQQGTLFLDEIGDLNLNLQAKLLRVLQEKEIKPVGSTKSKKVDVRIITATHQDLRALVKEGEFREDLFYRLSVIPLHVPSLQQRKEDIPLLANFFLKKYATLNSSPVKSFSSQALDKLINNVWEGNVRELENLIERTVVLCDKEIIGIEDIILQDEEGIENLYQEAVTDWPTLEELERRYILAVLDKVGGRKEKASQILGINRRTLYRKELEYRSVRH
ncbi:MAG: sigma-54-dependent Fis family transcriptional regulator [Bdellovibrionales bacterium]|nr:sigma-54-dependent Fis family transcriptional regulator [Bdellovibrionales bacterium]